MFRYLKNFIWVLAATFIIFAMSPISNQDRSNHHKRGIYVSLYSVVGERYDNLIDLVKQSGLNTIVVDVKNEYGNILYLSRVANIYNPRAIEASPYRQVQGMLQKAHQNGVYVIARIVVFKDDLFTKEHPQMAVKTLDKKIFSGGDKLAWVSPYATKYTEYLKQLSREVRDLGFDEIQYDYIRFH